MAAASRQPAAGDPDRSGERNAHVPGSKPLTTRATSGRRASYSWTVDTLPPTVTMTAPADNSFTNNNEPTFTATASDTGRPRPGQRAVPVQHQRRQRLDQRRRSGDDVRRSATRSRRPWPTAPTRFAPLPPTTRAIPRSRPIRCRRLASFNGTNGANPTLAWSRTAAAISSAPPMTAARPATARSSRSPRAAVPDQIVVAFVAKLKLYGIRPVRPLFAELIAYFGAVWREEAARSGGRVAIVTIGLHRRVGPNRIRAEFWSAFVAELT